MSWVERVERVEREGVYDSVERRRWRTGPPPICLASRTLDWVAKQGSRIGDVEIDPLPVCLTG